MQAEAQFYTLVNAQQTKLTLTNYGAAITDLQLLDKRGQKQHVVAGFNSAEDYLAPTTKAWNLCLGATVGRVANRISGGGFHLEGRFYPLPQNNGMHLHSEHCGLQHQIWTLKEQSDSKIVFAIEQEAGSCGYPGSIQVTATYSLNDDNQVSLIYEATTDAATVLNLCNHAYFNLAGAGSVLDHRLFIPSQRFLETDVQLVPTGRLLDTKEHNKDFSTEAYVSDRIGLGLDMAYALQKDHQPLRLFSENTGIEMQVISDQLAVQVYTPPTFEGLPLRGNNEANFPAICLEMQGYPDAPNRPEFPSIVVQPNEVYRAATTYSFSVRK
ncbi:aldose epimerase family protein [Gilvibacter sediminis]|uniref:aldose epimerase family protein n=1 Tax=Gilvibacter sediminis TaxID=379071 RepID=UPI00234FE82B|nr:aldose epimerase family protein [Gilvibacter sediminis]MDC7998492.1 galactose mutarotase [Gilvibacter sediminis]